MFSYFIQSMYIQFNCYECFCHQKYYKVTLVIPIYDELKDFYWKKICHPTTLSQWSLLWLWELNTQQLNTMGYWTGSRYIKSLWVFTVMWVWFYWSKIPLLFLAVNMQLYFKVLGLTCLFPYRSSFIIIPPSIFLI